MTAERWRQISAIYNAAIARAGADRTAYVSSACGGDDTLRREVELLLAQGESFLAKPVGLPPGSRLGAYELIEIIGAGGMGIVYRARDLKLQRDVALKVLPEAVAGDADRIARFRREAQLLASLNHPNIAAIYGFEDSGDLHALVLELVEGPTLADRIAQGQIPLDQALQIAIQIADALDKAHRAGIVHRDLKPGNIMLTKMGAKLLDFGLAKGTPAVVPASGPSMAPTGLSPITMQGTILGTLQYMSPEQIEGQGVDLRSDIFAFGCVLYEMLTGRPAFVGKTQASLIAAILEHDPPALHALVPLAPPALERLVTTCLAKDRDERWQSARDLMRELKWIALGETTNAPARAMAAQPVRASRILLPWIIAGLAVAGAAVLGQRAWEQRSPGPESIVRLTLAPPDGVTPVSGQPPALSPDGRHIAIVGTEASGRRLLWTRMLDAQVWSPLPGTDRAAWPFWSPDSQKLGFFADAKLMTVDASGRATPATVCQVNAGFGGSWSERGVIVFATRSTGPLFRVSATGGSPMQVTTLQADRGEIGHNWPQFIDDHRFVFTALAAQATANGTYEADLDHPSGQPIQVLPLPSVVAHVASVGNSRSGAMTLLFVRDGTLMAQSFDPVAGHLNGEPIAIAQGVARGGSGVNPMLSMTASNTGALAYVAGSEAPNTLTWFDREGRQLGTVGPQGWYRDPAFSPDGRTVVVARSPNAGGSLDLWGIDVDRPTAARRLTFNQTDARFASWSPDASALAFSASGKGAVGAYLKPLSGDAELLPQDGNTYVFDWSRDGKYLLLQLARNTHNDVAYMTLADRRIHPFANSELDERSPKFSPDGRWVAYNVNASGTYDVFVQAFPNGDQRIQISTEGGGRPLWSPDGRELFYIALNGELMAVPVKTTPNFMSGSPKTLFRSPVDTASLFAWYPYAVSREGQRFLFVTPAEDAAVSISIVLNWQETLRR